MAIKFSEFTIETSPTSVSYLVGYSGGINVQITPEALLAGHIPYSGATTDVFLGTHTIQSAAFKIPGGTLEQFLKADGSLDNNIYLTQNDLPTTLLLFATNIPSGINGYYKLVNTIDDPDYNTVAVNIPTGNIITTDQFIAGLITTPNQINGNPGIFNITTIGSIRKALGSGSGQATFFYRVYKRNNLGIETLVCTSDPTLPVNNGIYAEFQASGIFNDGVFGPTDYIVVKYYANRVSGGSNPAYEFRFGGDTPVRTVFPIPTSAIPNISLEQLNDVYIDPMTLVNGNTLVYDSMSQLWKNGAGGGGGGITNNTMDYYVPYSYSMGTTLGTSPIYINSMYPNSVYINTTLSSSIIPPALVVGGNIEVSGLMSFSNGLLFSNGGGSVLSASGTINLNSNPFSSYNVSIGNQYQQGMHKLYVEEQNGTGGLRILASSPLYGNGDIFNIDSAEDYTSIFAVNRTGKVRIKYDGGSLLYRDSSLLVSQISDATDGCITLNGNLYNTLLTGVSGDNTEVLRINNDGSIENPTGTIGVISDIRLKENIIPATPKLDDILKLNVVNYNLKNTKNIKSIGFIAQELEQIFPSLVTSRDSRRYDENGNVISGYEDSRGLKVGMEFAILTKAIQEQQAQIEELKKQLLNK